VIIIRPAQPADIDAMSAVLIASITDLCAADHQNDAAAIAHWTRNKSPAGVAGMLADPDLLLIIAERDNEIVGVAGLMGDTIGLNYVSPRHRFAGVSKAMMAWLEAELQRRGHSVGKLFTSITARAFYRAGGWVDVDAPDIDAARDGSPMQKTL
jgi:GNAT superfamily N-acetyltransferase